MNEYFVTPKSNIRKKRKNNERNSFKSMKKHLKSNKIGNNRERQREKEKMTKVSAYRSDSRWFESHHMICTHYSLLDGQATSHSRENKHQNCSFMVKVSLRQTHNCPCNKV